MRRVSCRLSVVCLLALPLLGCPPSVGEVADRHAPRVQALQAGLKQVMAAQPAPGALSAATAAAGLDPAPVYDEKGRTYTMDLLQVEQLDDPKLDLRMAGKLDLLLSNVVVQPLRDVTPEYLSESDRTRSSNDYYPVTFERALALPYVALVRTVDYAAPVPVNEKEFKGGHARLEVFLVDVRAGALKASFPVEARSSTDVTYEFREGEDDPLERLKAFAHSTLWSSAREQIAEGLRKHAGATVVFD